MVWLLSFPTVNSNWNRGLMITIIIRSRRLKSMKCCVAIYMNWSMRVTLPATKLMGLKRQCGNSAVPSKWQLDWMIRHWLFHWPCVVSTRSQLRTRVDGHATLPCRLMAAFERFSIPKSHYSSGSRARNKSASIATKAVNNV